ncbi:DDE-type integrase/transposase/recombinase [Aeromicrobium sp.]|uniref:DDE-type integrase/transposase/recombinase n=1 Tax=Aeromicrobium sp. TaxID=1871063 RepID=UPI00199B6EA5|nr:DDE-type integrase/transposase/recombinase [Aeromicrobium sp.]MBC7631268.1 DDE-type integrase/transposase/recombinase [Aeromicrobium sp.]
MIAEDQLITELTDRLGSQRRALELAGVSRSTWHYRTNPRPAVADPVTHKDRAYRSRISVADRGVVQQRIAAAWAAGNSVDHAFATAWDGGVMLASRRSWWRIAADMPDQSGRPVAPTRRGTTTPREMPVLEASGPGQVWSWDITDLRSPWRGKAFKAYSIIDIYSRKIVGFRVEEREADHLAVDLFEGTFDEHGIPNVVHADSGPAMRSNLLKDFLADRGVERTHSRPRVSNDNPYSESEFRTMKYRPNYPGTFDDLDAARAHMASYVPWYNAEHKHSGIALFSPDEVHNGTWRDCWTKRDQTQQTYYAAHPERFHHRPSTPAPAGIVGINLPKDVAERLQAA